MQIKKVLCLLLCLMMLVGLLAGCGNQKPINTEGSTESTPIQESTPPTGSLDIPNVPAYEDDELARAVELGIGINKDENAAVTFSEFISMLGNVISIIDEEKTADWEALFADASSSEKEMTRREGMVAVYFAAEVLGDNYYSYNNQSAGMVIFNEIASVDEWIFWDEMWDTDYALFPNVEAPTKNGEGSYVNAGYFYSMNRISMYSGKTIFDYDDEAKSMHPAEPLTYSQALAAAVRLYDSLLILTPRPMTDADKKLLGNADLRRESIVNSETSVTVTGNKYYVSNNGNDENDGLSEETPWRTLQKVNSVSLVPGDGVFFRRGDIWRGEPLIGQTGVTYSAYGTGAKPAIYGSPENGAGAEKWSLLDGTDNIWVFYRDIGDCGDLVIDGSMELADRFPVWWTGNQYVTYKSYDNHDSLVEKSAFNPATELNNLEYYVDIDYSDLGAEYPIYVFLENQRSGKLYLRCDEGNPGEIYSSIEFCCDLYQGCVVSLTDANDCIVDNLGIFYGGHALENCHGGLIQNCEVGFMGAMNHTFYYDEPIYSGDGIIHGNQMTVQNNYVHHTYNGGIAAGELSFAADDSYAEQEAIQGGNLVQGNLLEYTSGITLLNWESEVNELHMFKDITIRDNYVLYSECSGVADNKVAHDVVGSLVFTGSDQPTPNANENIVIEQNVFYCSKNALIISGMPENYYPTYSGNIYAQYPGYPFAFWLFRDGNFKTVFSRDVDALAQFVHDEIGDQTGVVLGE